MAAKQQALKEAQDVASNAVAGPQIRHIIRGISNYSNPTEGVYTASEVEMHIAGMEGWNLIDTHFLGKQKSASTGAQIYEFAYILVAA